MIRWLLLCAGCAETATIAIVPEIELPSDDDANALPELTQIRIALEGTRLEEVYERGEDIVLADVPLSSDLVLRLDGFTDGQGVAVGRTCTFSLADNERPSPRLYFSQVVRSGLLEQQAQARHGGAALGLADGTVLLLAGEGSSLIERYDPRAATLVEVPNAGFAGRTGAAIAVFEDGRPAIIGGLVGGAPATQALLVSSSGVIEEIPDVEAIAGRSNLTATALADGEILIAGGRDGAGAISNAFVRMRTSSQDLIQLELVNSAQLARARELHAVTPLGDGGASLLITGGNDAAGPLATTELYRVSEDEVIALPSPAFDLVVPRTRHRAALLPDESVVIVGGLDGAGNPVRVVERVSLITGVSTVAMLPPSAAAIDFSLLPLPDGTILLVGGSERDGSPALSSVSLVLFDPGTDSVSVSPRDDLAIPRIDPQLAVLCDGTVLISGGTEQTDFIERYNPNVRPRLD